LHHDESLAAEAHRERLAGAAPDQRSEAELVGAVVSGLQRGRPADRRLWIGVCGLVDGQHDRSALRGDGDAPGTRENAVEKAGAGEHADSLHHLDVIGEGRFEREHAGAVDTQSVTGREVDEVDVGGAIGEEDIALAAHLHERHPFAGQLLLEPLARAARAERLEFHLTLVGDHRAGAGHRLAVQLDLEHFGVLQDKARGGGFLFKVLRGKKCALHSQRRYFSGASQPQPKS
jgi:hypothetical protein